MAATLSWTIPSGTSDNTFSATLVSDQALQNVSLDDFVLRQVGGAFFEATAVATLHQVTGTHNWRLDVTLTGTYDADFWVRLREGRLTDEDGTTNALLTSSNFRVDSSHVHLTVAITGAGNIEQGEQVTLTATVTDADGNAVLGGLQYAWTASRGSFIGATNAATAVYHADFTETADVPVSVVCSVTRAANMNPTVSVASLTAMDALGITGQDINILFDALQSSTDFLAQADTLQSGSDKAFSSGLTIGIIRWSESTDVFALNRGSGETAALTDYWTAANIAAKSIYVIRANGTVIEIPPSDHTFAGGAWATWTVTDATSISQLDAIAANERIVVGVADTGSMGWDANSGSRTETFTAVSVPPLTIEAIDEQNIPILTEDYELEIDIGGTPTRAYVDGDMEGFYHEWDPMAAHGTGSGTGVLRIKSQKVTRLISAAIWNVHLVRRTRTLDRQITYNVVPTAPVITDPGAQKLYKGGLFSLDIDIANSPTIARGSGLLSGLKYEPRVDGTDGLNVAGRLPADANLTEAAFNAAIYAENNGGSDNFSVPVTIETHTGVYVFDSITDDLLKIGPDAATRHWTYEAPYPGSAPIGQQRYDPIVASPDGIYLFSDVNDDLLKVSPDGNLLWTFSDATSGAYNEMIVTESGVYVTRPGVIYKVHPATGALIWESDISYNYSNYGVYAGDVYFLNQGTNILTKLSGEDGTVAWTYPAPSGTWLRYVTRHGIYLQNGQQIWKVDIETGMLAWTERYSGRSLTLAANDEVLILQIATMRNQGVPAPPYNILRINPSNGTILWTSTTALHLGGRHIDPDAVYLWQLTTTTRKLLKLNLNTGTQAWEIDFRGSGGHPIFLPSGIYYLDGLSNRFTKLSKSTGLEDWSLMINKIRFSKGIIEEDSNIYALASFGSPHNVLKLNPSDGSERWRYVPASGRYASLALPDFSLGV